MSAVTGTVTAAAILATCAIISSRVSRWPSGRPSDQATPPLVVAIASAPASAISAALPASQAFGRVSVLPECNARSLSALAIWALAIWVWPATSSSFICRLGGVPCPGGVRARHGGISDADQELMVDLDELRDQAGELPGDELLVGVRTGVGVISGLVGEVLDEQQVVRPGRV